MKFKESKYYSEEFLGKNLYNKINENHEVLTVQEFFNININSNKKEFRVKEKGKNYKLTVFDNYYQLDSSNMYIDLFLVFDKPVHVTGKNCLKIIAPEILIKSNKNSFSSCCVANKMTINNKPLFVYDIFESKINNVHFYNSSFSFYNSEINIFFVFNNNLSLEDSKFLNYHKIKCFGKCVDLKKKLLNNDEFRKGIIHIE